MSLGELGVVIYDHYKASQGDTSENKFWIFSALSETARKL